MIFLTSFNYILSTDLNHTNGSNLHAINNTPNEEEIFIAAAKMIYSRVKYPLKDLGVYKQFINKRFTLRKIHSSKNTYIYRIKTNDSCNIIKYVKEKNCNNNEINIHSELNHENIVNLYRTYSLYPGEGYFLLMEPMDCSLSIEYAMQNPSEIKNIVKSIVLALKYLRNKSYVHNNITLENVLVKTVEGKKIYKLCDFKYTKSLDAKDNYPYQFNDPNSYTAPETIKHLICNENTDTWMLGRFIKFYTSKKIAFNDINYSNVHNSWEYFRYLYKLEEEQENGAIGTNIVDRCCVVNSKSRISLDEILEWCEREY